jgi:hypothetical protein
MRFFQFLVVFVLAQSVASAGFAYHATFKVSGAVRAPGDGSTKSFVLSSRRIEPKLEIRAAPAIETTAFLEARLVNDEEAPLLPGRLAVQRDGVHVGVSQIVLVAPGEANVLCLAWRVKWPADRDVVTQPAPMPSH